jgi:hypothetical protein
LRKRLQGGKDQGRSGTKPGILMLVKNIKNCRYSIWKRFDTSERNFRAQHEGAA